MSAKIRILDGQGTGAIATVSATGGLLVSVVPDDILLSASIIGIVNLAGGSVNTLQPLKATAYIEQSTNAIRSISSSSASDASGGVGANQVLLTYFDQIGSGPYTEERLLSGITPVNFLAKNICFIESIVVNKVGTSRTNVGTLTLFAGAAGAGGAIGTVGIGNVVSSTGDAQTLWAHHYVGAGRICDISGLSANSINGSITGLFLLKLQKLPIDSLPEMIVSDLVFGGAAGGQTTRQYLDPLKIYGPAHISMYVIPSANNGTFSGSFDIREMLST